MSSAQAAKAVQAAKAAKSYCYILMSTNTSKTYNGYTNRIDRRIRQHNKELVGGARATSSGGPWEYLVIITSDHPNFTKIRALSLEWSIRYPTNKRPRPREYSCPDGRIASLPLVFANPKFQEFEGTWQVFIHPNFYQRALELMQSINIQPMSQYLPTLMPHASLPQP